jgi:hypothetical protein
MAMLPPSLTHHYITSHSPSSSFTHDTFLYYQLHNYGYAIQSHYCISVMQYSHISSYTVMVLSLQLPHHSYVISCIISHVAVISSPVFPVIPAQPCHLYPITNIALPVTATITHLPSTHHYIISYSLSLSFTHITIPTSLVASLTTKLIQ